MQLDTLDRQSTKTERKNARSSKVPLRILLAEDDPEIRNCLSRILQHDGHEVYALSSGEELLEYLGYWLLEFAPEPSADVLITDIRMPGFDGLNIVEHLRASGWKVPVIFISAFADQKILERIDKLEQSVFFAKPFELSDLEWVVDHLAGDVRVSPT